MQAIPESLFESALNVVSTSLDEAATPAAEPLELLKLYAEQKMKESISFLAEQLFYKASGLLANNSSRDSMRDDRIIKRMLQALKILGVNTPKRSEDKDVIVPSDFEFAMMCQQEFEVDRRPDYFQWSRVREQVIRLSEAPNEDDQRMSLAHLFRLAFAEQHRNLVYPNGYMIAADVSAPPPPNPPPGCV